MFKVNNKDTRTYFLPYSSVSILNFEHVNDDWVVTRKEIFEIKIFSQNRNNSALSQFEIHA